MKLAFLLLAAGVATLQAQTFPSPNTTRPAVTHHAQPEYTKEATEAKLEGVVILSAVVATDGVPSEISVVEGLGKGLDEKAVECLQKWRFKPGTRDGEPVPMKVTVEMNFRLH